MIDNYSKTYGRQVDHKCFVSWEVLCSLLEKGWQLKGKRVTLRPFKGVGNNDLSICSLILHRNKNVLKVATLHTPFIAELIKRQKWELIVLCEKTDNHQENGS